MYTNRFINLLVAISLLAVTVLVVQKANATASLVTNFDSATHSYTAWAKAVEAEASPVDSATRSYIAWGQAMQARNPMDSGTRSYIAWGEALQAAEELSDSGACQNTTQENIFAGIHSSLDSATRSYIAWGLALQAKNDIGGLCR